MTEAYEEKAAAGEFILAPDPDDPRLVERCHGTDHEGAPVTTSVPVERPLTLYLNGQEIVTMMTIGDYPEYLAVGYLINQNMLTSDDRITAIDFDAEIDVVVVRTEGETDFEDKLRKKTLTSGCAQGTAFGDVMESFYEVELAADARVRTSWLYAISKKINSRPSIYLAAGAIDGCALCQEDRPLLYMEDVGRHNAIDKIAGYMFQEGLGPEGKLFYTTGRLTSEMVIKCVQMRIPVLISRSGVPAWGVALARRAHLPPIGRAKGRRFLCLAGEGRIVYDADPAAQPEEPAAQARKGGRDA
jgi:FdhD protein